jgi:hypothetical protein
MARVTRGGRSAEIASRSLLALAAVGLLVAVLAGLAHGERRQYGSLIVSLDGGISPLALPRDRPAPVTVDFDGALRTTDGSPLPRVVKVELALPGQGVISTQGLPVCPRERLRGADSVKALAVCRPALVGQGRIEADVQLPNQRPFRIRARLLIFNGRLAGGRQTLLLHAYTARPPIWVVLPFVVERRRGGWLKTVLVATLPKSLGPWPHFARFEMTLSRRYPYRGRSRSFLSAACPIPPRFTAGFFPFTKITYTLAGGRRVDTAITRGCRAR